MKKLLLIILVAFIVVSILTIAFNIQTIPTFSNFDDNNGDNEDDHYTDLNIVQPNIDLLHNFMLEIEEKSFFKINYHNSIHPFQDCYIFLQHKI